MRMNGILLALFWIMRTFLLGRDLLIFYSSIHDALCVMRALFQKRFIIPGGGAPEAEIAYRLNEAAKSAVGVNSICFRAFADAMEVIPATLAENSGVHPIALVTELVRFSFSL